MRAPGRDGTAAPARIRVLGMGLLLLAALRPARAQGLGSRFDAARDAAADVAHALARAAAERKRVIVDVGGQWCSWCHVMDRFIAAHPQVRHAIESDFVWVKVNVSPSNRNERLLSAWPKTAGYPHLFVLDAQGRLVHSQPGKDLEASQDYDAAKMLRFLRLSRQERAQPAG